MKKFVRITATILLILAPLDAVIRIFQLLSGDIHVYRFAIEYFFDATFFIGAIAVRKEYNPSESLIGAIIKRHRTAYLISFIPLVVLLVLGNTFFTFANTEISNCKNLLRSIGAEDSCISNFAIKKNDSTICKKSFLIDSIKQDQCLSDFAKEKGDVATCDKLSEIGKENLNGGPSFKDLCLEGIVEKHDAIEACDGLSSPAYKNDCYYELGSNFHNREACSKMVSGYYGWQPYQCLDWFRNDSIQPQAPATSVNSTQNPKRIFSPTILDISNWETYRDKKFWFEFQYPNDWQVYVDESLVQKGSRALDTPIFSIKVIQTNQEFKDWAKSEYSRRCPEALCTPLTAGELSDTYRNAYYFTNLGAHFVSMDIFIKGGASIFNFSLGSRKEWTQFTQEEIAIYSKILSTFELIK